MTAGAALLVTSVLPWPFHKNGGGQRTELLRRALRGHGYDVDVLGLVPTSGGGVPAGAANAVNAVEVADVDHSAADGSTPLRRLREAWSRLPRRMMCRYQPRPEAVAAVRNAMNERRYDLVVARYLQPAMQADLPATAGGVRCLLDLDDVDWLALRGRLAADPWPGAGGRIGMRRTLALLDRAAKPAARRFAGVWVASDEDRAAVARDGIDAAVLPNVPFDPGDPLPPSDAASRAVLFVGDLQHGPNKAGLDRFVSNVWPRVRGAARGATLRIVGRGLSDGQRSAWSGVAGVEPVGFADDLRAEYARAAVCVVPAWWGGGTKIKVAEAAALGRAQVAAPAAVRGYAPLVAAGAVAVADADAAFASAVTTYLDDAAVRRRAERAGLDAVRCRYSFDAVVRAVGRRL